MISIDHTVFQESDGLIPAIIQDTFTKQVLMLGYMNRTALEKTLSSGKVTFYSRSKKRLWTKGEESGNFLNLVQIQHDCDRDALLVEARPEGPTCHTGQTSCFHQLAYGHSIKDSRSTAASYSSAITAHRTSPSGDLFFLQTLQELLEDRKKQKPENSYTARLFQEGTDKLAQKVGEEAVETVIAAKNNNKELISEASDLLFHLMMLLTGKNLALKDLVKELKKRHHKDNST